jgi:hypothetical protein
MGRALVNKGSNNGPMTSLEVIAEKLQENRKIQFEDILRVSGSSAIAKDQYGITNVNDENIASSLIFKSLNKAKIDNNELIKAIDVNVTELKPDIPQSVKDLIPKPLYDEQVTLNADLTKQVETLNTKVEALNTEVTNLKSQVDTEINNRLNIEQANDALTNQLSALSKTVDDFSKQIQSSVQKSVDESILRASLQAQNVGYKAQIEALIKQIDSLNSIIEGLQAQLGAVQQQQAIQSSTQNLAFASGGDAINDVLVAKFEPKLQDFACQGAINNKNGHCRWEGGQTLEITNNDKLPVEVTIIIGNPGGQNWLVANPVNYKLDAGKTQKIGFGINSRGCSYGKRDRSTSYDGKITINVKRADGSAKSKEYKTAIRILHPKSYD